MLDAVAELLRVANVLWRDVRDPLGVDARKLQGHAKRDGGENGELVGGIDSLDVEGGIRLRVPEVLRLREHVGKRATLVAHLGQDEIAGAVDDSGDPLDAIAGQTLTDRLDDRNAAGHRRFEGHADAIGVGGGENLVAVQCDERLVGGHHVLAVSDRPHHEIERDIGSTRSVRPRCRYGDR